MGQGDAVCQWIRRRLKRTVKDRYRAPHAQNDNHHGGDFHDAYCGAARLVDALAVLPPKEHCDGSAKSCGEGIVGEVVQGMMQVLRDIVEKPNKILSSND